MVKYPNLKKSSNLIIHQNNEKRHYTSYRGMNLEEDLNLSNKYYLNEDIAVIYKKPTPIAVVKVDYPKRSSAKIVEAYYQKPSTTDYNGIYKGKYIDFEAKETRKDNFPFSNIYEHQILHLKRILDHGGIAFLIIAFTSYDEVYLLDASYIINKYYDKGKKSLSYDYIKDKGHLIKQSYQPRLDYLKILDDYYFEEENE